ncbi:MAG: hypothetical protein OEW15_01790 [Nitrospirota bacterium]|nr:hypothetical protein [Nitrospirota bacterium]
MSKESKIAVIAISLLFCISVLLFLQQYGASHRTILPSPLVRQVNVPQDAFAVWREQGMHGRTLVLIDRHLNADIEDRTDEFQDTEFRDTASLNRLCDALRTDLQGSVQDTFSCTIKGLNTDVLRRFSLYPLFLRKGLPDPSGQITSLAGYLALTDSFSVPIPRNSADDYARLNRLILEHSYPDHCPKRPEYHIVAGNYVHQAVRSGMVRKVYHLISDTAWETVASVLGNSKTVESSGGSFRMTIAEGISVRIMRFQDFPGLKEPVIVNLQADSVSAEERGMLLPLLRGKLTCDLLTVSGTHAVEFISDLRKADGTF